MPGRGGEHRQRHVTPAQGAMRRDAAPECSSHRGRLEEQPWHGRHDRRGGLAPMWCHAIEQAPQWHAIAGAAPRWCTTTEVASHRRASVAATPWRCTATELAPCRRASVTAAPRWRTAAEPAPCRHVSVAAAPRRCSAAGRNVGGRGTTGVSPSTSYPVNTWLLPRCACGRTVLQLRSATTILEVLSLVLGH